MREIDFRLLSRVSRKIANAVYSPLEREELIKSITEEFGLEPMNVLLLIEALEDLRESFPEKSPSWYIRAVLRLFSGIKKVSKNHWIVKGFKELGDQYPYYNVIFTKSGKYICDCHMHTYGHVRRMKICTHIAAVMVLRRVGRQLKIL